MAAFRSSAFFSAIDRRGSGGLLFVVFSDGCDDPFQSFSHSVTCAANRTVHFKAKRKPVIPNPPWRIRNLLLNLTFAPFSTRRCKKTNSRSLTHAADGAPGSG
jgi:hypothetical protein